MVAKTETAHAEIVSREAYKLKEVAAMLGISTKSVRRALSRGLMKSTEHFRHKLIPRSEITRFLGAK